MVQVTCMNKGCTNGPDKKPKKFNMEPGNIKRNKGVTCCCQTCYYGYRLLRDKRVVKIKNYGFPDRANVTERITPYLVAWLTEKGFPKFISTIDLQKDLGEIIDETEDPRVIKNQVSYTLNRWSGTVGGKKIKYEKWNTSRVKRRTYVRVDLE